MTDRAPETGLQSQFGPLEYAILDVLWTTAPLDVGDCVQRLEGGHAYTTIKTVMERLVKKGYLRRERQARSYLYWPVGSRQDVLEAVARRRSDELLAGFGPLAVTHFLRSVGSDTSRLNQLKTLLAEIEAGDQR